jgi:putative tryptophan/tyrosine transport system substrate-binding protein
MRRRELITMLGGAGWLATCPLAAHAPEMARRWRVGWLSPSSGPGAVTKSFVQAMEALGYFEGRNLTMEYRWAAGNSKRMNELAEDLVRTPVDLIVTAGTPATLAAKHTTSTIPIVFAAAGAPIEKGLVSSLSRPGGNVTGLALIMDDIKTLEILKEAAPRISRTAFIYDPETLPGRFGDDWLRLARGRSRRLGVELQPVILRIPNDTDQLFATLPTGIDSLLISNSSVNVQARRRICTMAATRGLPSASNERFFADAGCFLSYGESQLDMHRRAASYVHRIFSGTRPADLPVEQPTKFELAINLKTAKALRLEIPPMLLARADEVIE